MKAAGLHDTLTVINGPEDGTEFPLTQAEFIIGSGTVCAVNPRLDTAIEAIHARASAVADGYRVRSLGHTPIYVNGKATSVIRSQIAHAGDVLRVGSTELVLECSVDGRASRNRGIAIENDFAWALRCGALRAGRIVSLATRLTMRACRSLLKHKVIVALLAAFALYRFVPGFREWASEAWHRLGELL